MATLQVLYTCEEMLVANAPGACTIKRFLTVIVFIP